MLVLSFFTNCAISVMAVDNQAENIDSKTIPAPGSTTEISSMDTSKEAMQPSIDADMSSDIFESNEAELTESEEPISNDIDASLQDKTEDEGNQSPIDTQANDVKITTEPRQTYTLFYAEERSFDRDTTPLDSGRFECSFNNNVLKVKDNETGETFRPVDESVNNFWRFEDILYINPYSNGIVKYDLNTNNLEVLFEEKDISSLYLNPDIAFFVKDSEIHRFHLPSKTDEIIFSDARVVSCEPLSNMEVIIKMDNPEWLDYLSATGDYNDSANIPEYLWIKYDITDKTQIPYEWERVTATGPDIPMPRIDYGGWGLGSFFTETGKTDTNCHLSGICSWSNKPKDCKCKLYKNSIQCMAYAHYVFDQSRAGTWGSGYNRTLQLDNSSPSATEQSYAKLDKLFRDINSGSDIRIGGWHSFAFGNASNKTVYGYQVNFDESSCKVTRAKFSYDYLIRQGSISTHG